MDFEWLWCVSADLPVIAKVPSGRGCWRWGRLHQERVRKISVPPSQFCYEPKLIWKESLERNPGAGWGLPDALRWTSQGKGLEPPAAAPRGVLWEQSWAEQKSVTKMVSDTSTRSRNRPEKTDRGCGRRKKKEAHQLESLLLDRLTRWQLEAKVKIKLQSESGPGATKAVPFVPQKHLAPIWVLRSHMGLGHFLSL